MICVPTQTWYPASDSLVEVSPLTASSHLVVLRAGSVPKDSVPEESVPSKESKVLICLLLLSKPCDQREMQRSTQPWCLRLVVDYFIYTVLLHIVKCVLIL